MMTMMTLTLTHGSQFYFINQLSYREGTRIVDLCLQSNHHKRSTTIHLRKYNKQSRKIVIALIKSVVRQGQNKDKSDVTVDQP